MRFTPIEPYKIILAQFYFSSMKLDLNKKYLIRKNSMALKQLDYIFPFIVFFYGVVMVIVLEIPYFSKLGMERLTHQYTILTQHKGIAWLSFFIGGLWSLQNLFF